MEELENLSQVDSAMLSRPQRGISEVVGQDYDLLDDIEKHKDIYRLKVRRDELPCPHRMPPE